LSTKTSGKLISLFVLFATGIYPWYFLTKQEGFGERRKRPSWLIPAENPGRVLCDKRLKEEN